MAGSPSKFPDEPGIDRSKSEISSFSFFARARNVFQQPAELAPGEIGIDHQTRFLPDEGFESIQFEPVAKRSRAPVLPHDRIGDWLARLSIPDHRSLALVGDADAGDVLNSN